MSVVDSVDIFVPVPAAELVVGDAVSAPTVDYGDVDEGHRVRAGTVVAAQLRWN
jgi:hypothetical protein